MFTRFCFPEVKPAILGMAQHYPAQDAINMSLFNATALAYPPQALVSGYDTLRENGDAINSAIPPEPMVETLVEGLYANYFPGPRKKVWLVYNRSGARLDRPLIRTPFAAGAHYIEAFRDAPVAATREGESVLLSTPIENEQVLCIVELPEVAKAAVTARTLEMQLPAERAPKCRVEVAFGDDAPGKRQEVRLTDGKVRLPLPDAAREGRTIVRILDGYHLVDEVILDARTRLTSDGPAR